jgi:hypothetical protein
LCYDVLRMTDTTSPAPSSSGSRHVTMRVPGELYARLEALAADNGETVSQSARRLLSDGLGTPDRDAVDQAIATLLRLRRLLAIDARPAGPPIASRTVNILNAKTDLQHLIEDVGRGVEIIITHAGAQRARLVPIDETAAPAAPQARR